MRRVGKKMVDKKMVGKKMVDKEMVGKKMVGKEMVGKEMVGIICKIQEKETVEVSETEKQQGHTDNMQTELIFEQRRGNKTKRITEKGREATCNKKYEINKRENLRRETTIKNIRMRQLSAQKQQWHLYCRVEWKETINTCKGDKQQCHAIEWKETTNEQIHAMEKNTKAML